MLYDLVNSVSAWSRLRTGRSHHIVNIYNSCNWAAQFCSISTIFGYYLPVHFEKAFVSIVRCLFVLVFAIKVCLFLIKTVIIFYYVLLLKRDMMTWYFKLLYNLLNHVCLSYSIISWKLILTSINLQKLQKAPLKYVTYI